MNVKKYNNQSNVLATNIFETNTGVLNIAPIKISGQYKIVIALDNNLYLDDYTGRRIVIDKSKSFLPQVANFLKLKTNITNTDNLRYGAFQKSIKKSYHIPLYLGNSELPKYYILSRVVNETIKNPENLYKFGKILQIIDLNKIGLTNIFAEIYSEELFNYPLYFNFEDNYINLFGYDIFNSTATKKNIDIKNNQANQPYLENLNNTILNSFLENGLFYPKFLNLEFEFEFSNEYVHFNNFYGFLSKTNEIINPTYENVSENLFNIKLADYKEKIVWEQKNKTDISPLQTFPLNDYIDIIGSGSIQEISNQNYQFRFLLSIIEIGDTISIYHPINSLEFEYIVQESDIIKTSFYQTMIKICLNATKKSKNSFIFTVHQLENKSCIIKIVMNFIDTFANDYTINIPTYFTVLDRYNLNSNYYKFRNIDITDVCLLGQPNLLDNINQIKIDDIFYDIIEKFKFDNKSIIRLDKPSNITSLTECKIYVTKTEKFLELQPIAFLNYNSNLQSLQKFNKKKYVSELLINFGNNDSINEFAKTPISSFYQYITDSDGILEDSSSVIVENYNQTNCYNMLFASLGQNSYINPNILNIDKRFYLQNGNLDINDYNDINKFDWFLINGKCPNYLTNDVRNLRYFDSNLNEKPKLTSTLTKITENFVETIFLGVKYQLPLKYDKYQFAVYLNFDDITNNKINYYFEINDIEKTIYLVINKYLDFVDLLRGGDINAQPLLDLSFFYSTIEAFNSESTYVSDSSEASILLCEDFIEPIKFFDTVVNDWKYDRNNDQNNPDYVFALRLNNLPGKINDLRLLFEKDKDTVFYLNSKATINNEEIEFYSIKITAKNVLQVEETYIWCDDILIESSLKDINGNIIVNKFNELTQKTEWFYVNENEIDSNITNGNNLTWMQNNPNPIKNIWGNYVKQITLNGIELNFILLTKTNNQGIFDKFSLKESYFEIKQKITYNENLSKTITKDVLKLSENQIYTNNNITLSDSDLIDNFSNIGDTSSEYKITLFDRNQYWYDIKNSIKKSAIFKNSTKVLVKKSLDDFSIDTLIKNTNNNQIKINSFADNFLTLKIIEPDKNVVIWDILNNHKIYSILRHHCDYYPFFEISNNEIDFQLPIFKNKNSLFNIYDENFGGELVSATGIWNEIQGNIVSSIYCKNEDILITTNFNENINYFELLLKSLDIEKIIIRDWNINYLQKIDKNINEYILNSYTKYLLDNFFNLDSVINEFNKKISFSFDSQNKNFVTFSSIDNTQEKFSNLIFIFKRK